MHSCFYLCIHTAWKGEFNSPFKLRSEGSQWCAAIASCLTLLRGKISTTVFIPISFYFTLFSHTFRFHLIYLRLTILFMFLFTVLICVFLISQSYSLFLLLRVIPLCFVSSFIILSIPVSFFHLNFHISFFSFFLP
jgi:hypothetical protein